MTLAHDSVLLGVMDAVGEGLGVAETESSRVGDALNVCGLMLSERDELLSDDAVTVPDDMESEFTESDASVDSDDVELTVVERDANSAENVTLREELRSLDCESDSEEERVVKEKGNATQSTSDGTRHTTTATAIWMTAGNIRLN